MYVSEVFNLSTFGQSLCLGVSRSGRRYVAGKRSRLRHSVDNHNSAATYTRVSLMIETELSVFT